MISLVSVSDITCIKIKLGHVLEYYIVDYYDELCKDMAKELNLLIVSVE